MRFELLVLGANSATPMPGRFPSSFVLNHNESLILLDCGEGAQIKMSQFGVRRSKIDHIFITHLHGDHVFGLPGFINSLSLNSRTRPLYIYGPIGIRELLDTVLRLSGAHLNFDLIIEEIGLEKYHKVCDLQALEVYAFPMKHRILTFGYKFKEKKRMNLNTEAIEQYGLNLEEIKAAKRGEDVVRGSEIIGNQVLTRIPDKPRTFVLCSDTVFDPSVVSYLNKCDLLYHEATYMDDLSQKARERMHCTAKEASIIAKKAKVGKLLIGHYSSRYKDLQPLLDEARELFSNTQLALEGMTFTI